MSDGFVAKSSLFVVAFFGVAISCLVPHLGFVFRAEKAESFLLTSTLCHQSPLCVTVLYITLPVILGRRKYSISCSSSSTEEYEILIYN